MIAPGRVPAAASASKNFISFWFVFMLIQYAILFAYATSFLIFSSLFSFPSRNPVAGFCSVASYLLNVSLFKGDLTPCGFCFRRPQLSKDCLSVGWSATVAESGKMFHMEQS